MQVVKEPLGTKGARLTSHVTMAGRFLVFMPTVDHIGVSRKIESREERARRARHRPAVPRGPGVHRRRHHPDGGRRAPAGGPRQRPGVLPEGLGRDLRQKVDSSRCPAAVYREQGLVSKLVRDQLTDEYTAIRLDDEGEYRRVQELVDRFMPQLAGRVKLYTKPFPIFEEYGVQSEIDKALRSKVWLKSGGYIVINQTEALVAIDVNTGRFVGKRNDRLEDTIVKTNLEAVKEIVRQIRLRDLGGIIVLDFIDMEEKKNRQKVAQALEQELKRDRSPSKAVQVSDFGLIIITRKRVKQSLERVMTEPCPYCSGTGTIKSSSSMCYEILDEVRKLGADIDGPGPGAARESRHRAGAQAGGVGGAARAAGCLEEDRDRAARRLPAPRAVRRDGDLDRLTARLAARLDRGREEISCAQFDVPEKLGATCVVSRLSASARSIRSEDIPGARPCPRPMSHAPVTWAARPTQSAATSTAGCRASAGARGSGTRPAG